MSKALFLKIFGDIETSNEYFQESWDGRNKKSFTQLQNVMSARTSRECLKLFCESIIGF